MPSRTPSEASPPLVWLLMGDRVGDNSQVLGLGEALGWPLVEKHFIYTPWEKLVNLPFGAHAARRGEGALERARGAVARSRDLGGAQERADRPLHPQAGRRADKRVRLIHVGRPWAKPSTWDLVITTPQYRLPRDPNIVHNETPLHRVTRARLDEAARAWEARVAHLPRPRIAVLAGGNSGPYPFNRASGARLADMLEDLVRDVGGSLLVTTSARTLDETTDALFGGIHSPSLLYRWKKGDPDNPFFAFLGLADRVVVTADSVSMMTEACATGRPVYLYDTGEGRTSMKRNPWLDGEDEPRCGGAHVPLDRWHLKAWIYRLTMRLGPQRLTRDIRIVQQLLVDSERAIWLGDGHPKALPRPLDDMPRAVARVRGLFSLPIELGGSRRP